jgi:pyruvate formate-lyase activating enzyme-like uncharacterized protein
VPNELLTINLDLKRLELAPWILETVKGELDKKMLETCYLVEEYPTADRLEVERIPLEKFK